MVSKTAFYDERAMLHSGGHREVNIVNSQQGLRRTAFIAPSPVIDNHAMPGLVAPEVEDTIVQEQGTMEGHRLTPRILNGPYPCSPSSQLPIAFDTVIGEASTNSGASKSISHSSSPCLR